MTLQSDLIAARALIDTPEKWGKWTGHFVTDDGSVKPCALEACRLVEKPSSYSFSDMRTYRALLDALPPDSRYRAFAGGEQPYLGGYNDDPETTHADVMAWFDRAIKAAS